MIWTIIPIVGAAAVVGAGLYYGNNHIEVSRYDISSCKVPKAFNGYKIVQLSDLHSKTFGKDNRKLIEFSSTLRFTDTPKLLFISKAISELKVISVIKIAPYQLFRIPPSPLKSENEFVNTGL